MIVEDAEMVRRPIAEALRLHGYKVIEAAGGREAIAMIADYGDKIHLLLSDIMMPDMNGGELGRHLTRAAPEMKLLFMSGYSGDTLQRITLTNNIDVLPKPFSIQQLTQKVTEILRS